MCDIAEKQSKAVEQKITDIKRLASELRARISASCSRVPHYGSTFCLINKFALPRDAPTVLAPGLRQHSNEAGRVRDAAKLVQKIQPIVPGRGLNDPLERGRYARKAGRQAVRASGLAN